MKAYSATDVGRVRKMNQDYIFASETPVGNLPNLFVVADGMGGHKAGDFASSHGVSVLLESIRNDREFNPIKIIRHAMEKANVQILEQAQQNDDLAGMGTTMVVCSIVGHYAYVANVGDSRLYVAGDAIQQITRDHSLVAEMVRLGQLDEEEARNHPDKNIITRAMGIVREVAIDFFDIRLEENSRILMCSDGLSNMLTDEEMFRILKECEQGEDPTERLIGRANENGGKDNIAVIVVEPFTNEVKE